MFPGFPAGESCKGGRDVPPELTPELIVALITEPSADNYRVLHAAVVSHPDYAPYDDVLEQASELLEGEAQTLEALEMLQEAMPNLLLSPRAHMLKAYIHRTRGEADAEEMEILFASACVRGILATGNGSELRPYLVTRTSDEHDVAQALERTLEEQRSIERNDRSFDVWETDAEPLWFDVTDALQTLG